MKRYAAIMTVAIIATAAAVSSARAQDNDGDAPDVKKKAPKEIIIRKLDDGEKRTVIVIEGGKVTVNGKPAGEWGKGKVMVVPDGRDETLFGEGREDLVLRKAETDRVMRDVRIKMLDVKDAMGSSVRLGVYTKENEKGAEVVRVDDSSAAFKAGLKTGDIIVKVGESPITDPEALAKVVRTHKPDEKVSLTYLRNGRQETADVTLQKPKAVIINDLTFAPGQLYMDGFKGMGDNIRLMMRRPRLGAHIQDMEDSTGVKVLQVDPESPAATAGLQKDDVITGIDGQTVTGTDMALKALKDTEEKHSYSVTVNRGGQTLTLQVKIPHELKSATL